MSVLECQRKGVRCGKLIKKAQKGGEEAFIQAITEYMPVLVKAIN